MKNISKKINLTLFAILTASMLTASLTTTKATADPGPRAEGYGYFTNDLINLNGTSPLSRVIQQGITGHTGSKAEFIRYIEGLRNGGDAQDRTGAQFIIQLMRKSGPRVLRPTDADVADWENRINNPNITFDSTGSETDNWNSGYARQSNSGTAIEDDVFYRPFPADVQSFPALVIRDRGVKVFTIKLLCGNPLGDLPGLPLPERWNLTGRSSVSSPTASRATNITATPGQTVRFYHDITNARGSSVASTNYIIRADYSRANVATGTDSSIAAGVTDLVNYNDYVVPNLPGTRYCQIVAYTDDTGPGTRGSMSTFACVTVAAAARNAPIVTLSCSPGDVLRGTATDRDRATALSIQFYRDGGAYTTGVTTTNSSGRFTANVASGMGGVSHTFYVTAKGVNSSGVRDGINGTSATVTCTPPALPVAVVANCTTPTQSTTTPETAHATPTSGYGYTPSTPPLYSRTAGSRIATETGGAGYQIDSAHDQYTPSTAVTWTVTGRQTSNAFTLNYANYVRDYPYDSHDTTVGFTEYWSEQQYYSSSSIDGYTCNRGDPSPSGATCTHTTTSLSGTTTTIPYPADPYHNWHAGGTATRTNTGVYAPTPSTFPECYDRHFNVHAPSEPTPSTVTVSPHPDTEDPNQIVFSSTVYVDFTYNRLAPSPSGLRNANRVSLDYSVNYYFVSAGSATDPASGSPFPVSCGLPPGGSVVVSGRNIASPNESASVSSTCNATLLPPLTAGDRVCAEYTFNPKGDSINQYGTITVNNGVDVVVYDCSAPLTNQPYAHFFGQDVSAGGSFANGAGDECSASVPTLGNILGNLKTTGPLARGTAAQFAGLSLGSVSGFASASLRPGTPTANDDLTLANSGTLGHQGTRHCVPDFYASKSGSKLPVSSSSLNLHRLDGRGTGVVDQSEYIAPSGMTISGFRGGAGIADGNRVAIYVTGDVYIQHDIKFKSTAWMSVDEIPSFYLIVKGDIYIDPGVSQLDGVYVAQPDRGRGGTISTCAPGLGQFAGSQLYANCQNQLTVNGAFVASDVRLLRTNNSLRNSLGGERPLTTGDCSLNGGNGSRTGTNYDCAAEIFNFSPEVYLSRPGFNAIGGPSVGKYDYITSLSPVL